MYDTDVLYPYAEEVSQVTDPSGASISTLPPDETSRLVRQLRELMYQDHAGTGFSFRLTIRKTGGVDAEFNYDNEPNWADEVDGVYYVQDLERFPRDDEHTPGWLARELVRGLAEDLEYDKTEGPRKRIPPISGEG